MPISENIKILREKYKLSQKDLAQIAGVTDKAVSTWERGIKEPRMGAIQRIADHFGLKKSDLIEDNGMKTLSTLCSSSYSPSAQHYEQLVKAIPDIDIAIDLYTSLDEIDRSEIRGEMKGMLRADKYKSKIKDESAG